MSATPENLGIHLARKSKQTDEMPRRGPTGDVQPNFEDPDPRTRGGKPQEDVEDRPVVGIVTPEAYPEADRDASKP